MPFPTSLCQQLEQAGPEAQQALAPFLRSSVLRRVVLTLGNTSDAPPADASAADPAVSKAAEELAAWACNPRLEPCPVCGGFSVADTCKWLFAVPGWFAFSCKM